MSRTLDQYNICMGSEAEQLNPSNRLELTMSGLRIVFGTLAILFMFERSCVAQEADAELTMNFPQELQGYAVASGGQRLVIRLAGQPELIVYDITQREITGTIQLESDDFAFAAGGNHLLVFDQDAMQFQLWNVEDCTLIRSKEFFDSVQVLQMIMGSAQPDWALILMKTTNRSQHYLIHVPDLSIQREPYQTNYGNMGHLMMGGRPVHWRADENFEQIAGWSSQVSPNGIGVILPSIEERSLRYSYAHHSAGYLVPASDGLLYTGYQGILRMPKNIPNGSLPQIEDMRVLHPPKYSLIPGLGQGFFVGVNRHGEVDVFREGTSSPLCRIERFPEWFDKSDVGASKNNRNDEFGPAYFEDPRTETLTFDQRIVFAPSLGEIVFFPFSNRKLVQRKFNLEENLNMTGEHFLLVLSTPPIRANAGAIWAYEVRTLAKNPPVQFRLETAPEGMAITDDGRLLWKIPANIIGRGPVSLEITDSQGSTISHDFTISFQ